MHLGIPFVVMAFCGTFGCIPPATAEGAFGTFSGRWVGNGQLNMSDGKVEHLKCISTYFPSNDGSQLKMSVRCASTGYKIDAVGHLAAHGNSISGTFEERNYNSSGSISGTANGGNISAFIRGGDFSASLSVSGGGAQVEMRPQGGAVRSVTMHFHKG